MMDFLDATTVKFVFSTIVMIVLSAIVLFSFYYMTKSIKTRKNGLNDSLPSLEEGDKTKEITPFKEEEVITIELVENEDDLVTTPKENNEVFVNTLMMETGKIIVEDIPNDGEIMPELSEGTLEEHTEKIKAAKEKENLERIKKLALADQETPDFISIGLDNKENDLNEETQSTIENNPLKRYNENTNVSTVELNSKKSDSPKPDSSEQIKSLKDILN